MNGRLLAVAALLLLTPSAGADWLQAGGDEARAGRVAGLGPATDDIAWTLNVPGSRATYAPPVVIGSDLFILTSDRGIRPGLDTNGLFRIDHDQPDPELLTEFPGPTRALGSDGSLLFIAHDEGIEAVAPTDGTQAWSWPAPRILEPRIGMSCTAPAIGANVVIFACNEVAAASRTTAAGTGPTSTAFTVALRADTGDELWRWVQNGPPDGPPATASTSVSSAQEVPMLSYAEALTALGSRVYVVTNERRGGGDDIAVEPWPVGGPAAGWMTVSALDARTGELVWVQRSVVGGPSAVSDSYPRESGLEPSSRPAFSLPVATPSVVYVKLGSQLYALNAVGGSIVHQWSLAREDATVDGGASGHAFAAGSLYAVSAQTMFKFNVTTYENPWRRNIAFDEAWAGFEHAVSGELLYALAYRQATTVEGAGPVVYALDTEDGRVAWRLPLPAPSTEGAGFSGRMAVSDGVLVVADFNGNVTVVGTTGGSLVAHAELSSSYPAAGEEVTVDLSMSQAGYQGAPTGFRAEWGDGSVTPLQGSPRLTHVYTEEGDHRARFQVGNEAGQTASTFATFAVGADAPNFIETAFARENQDLTFGVLGVGLALAGGVVAVAGRRRRHGRLQRELAAIDKAAEAARDNPARLRAAMDERRAHCHGLLLNRRIDEPQFAVLERHIDEIGRRQRVDQMRELFDFLPTAMTRALEEMLSDGRITAWERESFHAVLEANEVLTAAQKRKVGAMIDGWFDEDGGAPT